MPDTPDQKIAKSVFKKFQAENFSNLSDDDAFERFGAYLMLKKYNLSTSELDSDRIAGTYDGGLDGFFMFLNGSELVESDSPRLTRRASALNGLQHGVALDVVIIQAKNQAKWDNNAFPRIQSTLEAIFDTAQTENDLRSFPLNEDVVEKARVWRTLREKISHLAPKVSFQVKYVTLAPHSNLDKYANTKAGQLQKWLSLNLPSGSKVTADYIGAEKVVEASRESADFKVMLKLAKEPVREGSSIVGLVSIKNYLSFLRVDKTKVIREELFALNVRDYAGRTVRVNNAIGETLKNDGGAAFWWLNNGITIIVDKFDDSYNQDWVLTNPVVVNGLQTSHVIHEQDVAGGVTAKRRNQFILVKVIAESDPEIRESIIGGTNNQTAIASLQLHANETKQKQIEDFLQASGWYYERRRYQYRGMKVKTSRIRNATELGQAVIAFKWLEPDTARARPTSLLGTKAGWEKVFGDDSAPELYLKALEVVDAVDAFLRSAPAKKVADDPTNVRFYLVAGYALLSSGAKNVVDFQKIPDQQRSAKPSAIELLELHELLRAEVEKLDDHKAGLDRLFKGPQLKNVFFNQIGQINSQK